MATSHGSGRPIVRVALALLAAALIAEVIAVVVFRTKWRPAIDLVRRTNRAVLNPAMLHLAGGKHWYAAVVRHVGRRSGRSYATPVLAERAGGRLYIPLPYGTHVDWLANVLAAGGCIVECKGERHRTTAPVVIPAAEAAPALRPRRRAAPGFYGVDAYLRLDIAE
jgi:deazaflavin-dependent oxidoreductase (nitroreductase family)